MDTTLTRIIQGIYKQGLYKIITEITGAGELSKDCHKSLSIKEGVSYLPFDCAMCKGPVKLSDNHRTCHITVYCFSLKCGIPAGIHKSFSFAV